MGSTHITPCHTRPGSINIEKKQERLVLTFFPPLRTIKLLNSGDPLQDQEHHTPDSDNHNRHHRGPHPLDPLAARRLPRRGLVRFVAVGRLLRSGRRCRVLHVALALGGAVHGRRECVSAVDDAAGRCRERRRGRPAGLRVLHGGFGPIALRGAGRAGGRLGGNDRGPQAGFRCFYGLLGRSGVGDDLRLLRLRRWLRIGVGVLGFRKSLLWRCTVAVRTGYTGDVLGAVCLRWAFWRLRFAGLAALG